MEPYVYKDLNEVPSPWRTLQGGRLSLDEVNAILADAYANPIATEGGPVPDLGGARERFMQVHELQDGLWVPLAEVTNG